LHTARSHSRCSEEPGLPSPPEDRGAELRCKQLPETLVPPQQTV
jgi:hypothetical protein